MYSRHRFPREIISHCVWLYYTFPLSYRDIEKMMLDRGIEVTYETIRDHFHPKQHQLTAHRYRQELRQRFQDWREVTGLKSVA